MRIRHIAALAIQNLVACAAAISIPATAAFARDFDWVQIDPMTLSTNPAFLQSSLDVTSSGEPVRARLVESHLTAGIRYMGDYAIEQFASDGTLLWQELLLGKVDVLDLRVRSTGSIVVIGSYRDTLSVDEDHELIGASGQAHPFFLKFDSNQDVEWLVDPSATDPDVRDIEAMTIDSQDRVWIGLSTWSNGTRARRLNADGTPEIEYVQQGTRGITGIAADPDGTVWTVGSTSAGTHDFNGLPASTTFSYNVYVAKYSPSGVGEWVRFVEDVTFQSPRVVSDGMGSAYAAGSLFGDFTFGGLMPEGVDWIYDFFLTKIDADGNFLWLREVPADGVSGDGGPGGGALLETSGDGSLWFSGFSRLDVDWGNDGNVPPSYGSQDALVLEYSLNGAFLSAKTAGSPGFDVADAVAVGSNGTVYIAGTVGEDAQFDDQPFTGNFTNAFLASLPPDNVSGIEDADGEWSPFALGALGSAPSLHSHPNPFRPSTRIEFRLEQASLVDLGVYDAAGTLVRTLETGVLAAGPHRVEWNGRDDAGRPLPSGVYIFRLETPAGTATGRATLLR